MQDRIEELEYIKTNMTLGSNSSLFSNETDENTPMNYDQLRRESLLFLHEAQRLANERRTSLAQLASLTQESDEETTDTLEDNEPQTFTFDQRSEETNETANLTDFQPVPPSPVSPPTPIVVSSRSPVTLPFTYINQREQIPLSTKLDINSPTDSIDDVADIATELNLTLVKREVPKPVDPILFTKATVNRTIQFRKIRPMSLKREIPIHITVICEEDTVYTLKNN